MLYGYIIILCLIMLLAGYSVGRRKGIDEGMKKGRDIHATEDKCSDRAFYYSAGACNKGN